jgi:hypothetical protein
VSTIGQGRQRRRQDNGAGDLNPAWKYECNNVYEIPEIKSTLSSLSTIFVGVLFSKISV